MLAQVQHIGPNRYLDSFLTPNLKAIVLSCGKLSVELFLVSKLTVRLRTKYTKLLSSGVKNTVVIHSQQHQKSGKYRYP